MVLDCEFRSIKNDKLGIGGDIDVDGDRAGESAGGKIRFQPDVVPSRNREFRKARLPFELLHLIFFC